MRLHRLPLEDLTKVVVLFLTLEFSEQICEHTIKSSEFGRYYREHNKASLL